VDFVLAREDFLHSSGSGPRPTSRRPAAVTGSASATGGCNSTNTCTCTQVALRTSAAATSPPELRLRFRRGSAAKRSSAPAPPRLRRPDHQEPHDKLIENRTMRRAVRRGQVYASKGAYELAIRISTIRCG